MNRLSRLLLIGTLAAFPAPACLAAQGVEMITAADIARYVGVIAADSMLGRDTPSRGLESTARYIAGQFERIGLAPLSYGESDGRDPTWFHRYKIPFDFARSAVVFESGGRRVPAWLTTAARLPDREVPQHPAKAGVVLVAGRHTPKEVRELHTDDKIVLYVPPRGTSIETLFDPSGAADSIFYVRYQLSYKSQGMVVLTEDSTGFIKGMQKGHLQNGIGSFERHKYYRTNEPRWEGLVLPAAAPGLQALLAAQGVDLTQLRADSTPVVRELPALQVFLDMQFEGQGSDTTTAPNVVGMIEGSDSTLKDQYVVFSAHMDYLGVTPGRADSINHGADDNASGTAALIALANAFNQPGARPRRSVLFVATSGGAKPGLWGSHALVESFSGENIFIEARDIYRNVVAAINLDMIGSGPHDSVTVDGLRTMNFKMAPGWVAAAHPELRLAVVDGGTIFRPESDHFSFATNYQVIPSLSFQNGRHGDPHLGPDTPAAVDAEQVARIARLVFYISQEFVNDTDVPRLNAEGRRQMMESQR